MTEGVFMIFNRMIALRLALMAALIFSSEISRAGVDCIKLNDSASNGGVYIAGGDAGRTVTGKGRLQFYSAPDFSCPIKGTFILQGESVDAYTEYGRFTSIVYLGSNSKYPVTGWVESNRLKPNGRGIAPPQ
jgi:hypothetical protein